MEDKSRLAAVAVLVVLAVGTVVLLFSVMEGSGPKEDRTGEDNEDYVMTGKTDYRWAFKDGEKTRYQFIGRKTYPSAPKDVYDPETWEIVLFGVNSGEADFEFYDGSVRIIQGKLRSEGVILVSDYSEYSPQETEFSQILLNILLLTPKQTIQKGVTRTEKFILPSRHRHKVEGTAEFRGEGSVKLQGIPSALEKISSSVVMKVKTKEKEDLITEFHVEGFIYWDPVQSRVFCGGFEYAAGRANERYYAPWRYTGFVIQGFPFPPPEADLTTLGMNVLWTLEEDITQEERTMRSLQKNARDQLDHMADVQEDFRKRVLVDQDGDGKGEYGLLSEIGGCTKKVRGKGKRVPRPQPWPNLKLSSEFGKVNTAGFSYRDGYNYQMFLKGAKGLVTDSDPPPKGNPGSADVQEEEGGWCGYSWPREWGKDGKAVYFCNGKGSTWESRDFQLSGSDNVPRPTDTKRPTKGTWVRVSRIEALPRIPMKLTVVRGKFASPDLESLVMIINGMRFQIDQLALGKVLANEDFRRIEAVNREFNRARGDFLLEEEEAERAIKGYTEIIKVAYLRRARVSLLQGQKIMMGLDEDPLGDRVAEKIRELERLERGAPEAQEVVDFLKSVHDLVKKVELHRRKVEKTGK